jgi:hypothetical protein
MGFGQQRSLQVIPTKRLSLACSNQAQVTATPQPPTTLAAVSNQASTFAPFSAVSPSIAQFVDATSSPMQSAVSNVESLLVLEDEPEPPLPSPAEGDISPKGLINHLCGLIE